MPQLDVSTFSSQLFWLGVCFLFLYGILYYVTLPKIIHVLETREKGIEDKLNKASLYREQAESLLTDYEVALAKARHDSQEKTRIMAQSIGAEITCKQKDFLDRLAEKLHMNEQELYRTRLQMRKGVKDLSKIIAQAILEKITGHPYSLEELEKP